MLLNRRESASFKIWLNVRIGTKNISIKSAIDYNCFLFPKANKHEFVVSINKQPLHVYKPVLWTQTNALASVSERNWHDGKSISKKCMSDIF